MAKKFLSEVEAVAKDTPEVIEAPPKEKTALDGMIEFAKQNVEVSRESEKREREDKSAKSTIRTLIVPHAAISPDPENFYHIDEGELQNLADDIRARGLYENIVVRSGVYDETYIIVDGERRWRALRMLIEDGAEGFDEVPVNLKDIDPDEAMIHLVAANENQRNTTSAEKLKAVEKVHAIVKARADGTVKQVAIICNMTLRMVRIYLSLSKLDPELRRQFDEGKISLREAQKLAQESEEVQSEIASEIDEITKPTEAVEELPDTSPIVEVLDENTKRASAKKTNESKAAQKVAQVEKVKTVTRKEIHEVVAGRIKTANQSAKDVMEHVASAAASIESIKSESKWRDSDEDLKADVVGRLRELSAEILELLEDVK